MARLKKTAKEIADLTGATLDGDQDLIVEGVGDLASASPSQVAFFANPRYAPLLGKTEAKVILVPKETPRIEGKTFLFHADPSAAFQKVLDFFCKDLCLPSGFDEAVHPSAVIHETAQIDPTAKIGPNCVIDQKCVIGPGTVLQAQVFVGAGTKIGKDCTLYPNVTVREGCELHDRVILQPGVVIGSCGFGYATSKEGKHTKEKQFGNVVIEEDVEIGAGTTVDRGRFTSTRIKKGSKIDNLVMIAHGVEIGEDNLVIAQTGIAGSSKTGRNVVLAAQSGLAGHIRVGDFVQIAGRGGVTKNIPDGFAQYGGAPAQLFADHQKTQVLTRNLGKFVQDLKELKKKVGALETR